MSETKTKGRAFWVLTAFTLVYFAIYYFLLVETKECTDASISPHWFKGFFDTYLGCVGVNELGDALAGAFAPVAFLWLAGAVFIQSQELAAQREELDETRKVMKEQVLETRASTTLLGEQTGILRRQHELKEQEIADDQFDAMIRGFRSIVERFDGVLVHIVYPDSIYPEWKGSLLEMGKVRSDEDFFIDLNVGVASVTERINRPLRDGIRVAIRRPQVREIESLRSGLPFLLRHVDKLSPAYTVKASSFGMAILSDALASLVAAATAPGVEKPQE
ncbi:MULTISPECIES: hypothetical protein [unclassified Ensifer]|uniref:hypothetical protein n=1 Tax=unclassified Ensifer TaxID=2633371 RepID=UPI00081331B3|nr:MULTISPECIES: hypothetical protein [unclassified Ensifer]OCP17406.1 hypothetical protein BC361_08075 [Ensifer sp. LC54]OCP28688.1 hypothetical protein BC363_02280 [Ensifer sp. LC384]